MLSCGGIRTQMNCHEMGVCPRTHSTCARQIMGDYPRTNNFIKYLIGRDDPKEVRKDIMGRLP
jgi:hypothetical protein